MNKKFIFLASTIIMFIILFNYNISYASSIGDVFNGGDNFVNAGTDEGVNTQLLNQTSNMVYNILMAIGISIAVIIAGILGIQFMISSAEEKAQVKEKLIPFIVGCIVVFGAFSIWKIVVNIGNKL